MSYFTFCAQNYSLSHADKRILSDINFEVKGAGSLAIMARSGVGKSTLLCAATQLLDQNLGWHEEGVLSVNGTPVSQWDPVRLRRTCTYVPQKSDLFGSTVADNLLMPQRKVRPERSQKDREERAFRAIGQSQLSGVIKDLNMPISKLASGGQKQRLALARALVVDADCLMFDEPTSALDPLTTSPLETAIFDIAKEKRVIIVTHDCLLAQKCDDILFLHDKGDAKGAQVSAAGPAARTMADPEHEHLYNFVMARKG